MQKIFQKEETKKEEIKNKENKNKNKNKNNITKSNSMKSIKKDKQISNINNRLYYKEIDKANKKDIAYILYKQKINVLKIFQMISKKYVNGKTMLVNKEIDYVMNYSFFLM